MNEVVIVEKIIKEKLGKLPLKVEKIAFGFLNNVYNIIFSDYELIIRTNIDGQVIKNYEKNLKILRNLEIPVPDVILMDNTKTEYEIGYIILSKIKGKDLRFEIEKMSKEEMSVLAEKIIFYQGKVMNLPTGRGFGRGNINEIAKFNSWASFIEDKFLVLVNITRKLLTEDKINAIHKLIIENNNYFETIRAIPFMDEIGLKNVMIQNGEFRGFIDFDWICYGDPLYLVGLIQTGSLLHLDKKCIFYVEELCRLMNVSNIQRRTIDIYSLIYALEFISFQMKNNNFNVISSLIQRIELLLKRFS